VSLFASIRASQPAPWVPEDRMGSGIVPVIAIVDEVKQKDSRGSFQFPNDPGTCRICAKICQRYIVIKDVNPAICYWAIPQHRNDRVTGRIDIIDRVIGSIRIEINVSCFEPDLILIEKPTSIGGIVSGPVGFPDTFQRPRSLHP
jgi:hypothetical protein